MVSFWWTTPVWRLVIPASPEVTNYLCTTEILQPRSSISFSLSECQYRCLYQESTWSLVDNRHNVNYMVTLNDFLISSSYESDFTKANVFASCVACKQIGYFHQKGRARFLIVITSFLTWLQCKWPYGGKQVTPWHQQILDGYKRDSRLEGEDGLHVLIFWKHFIYKLILALPSR